MTTNRRRSKRRYIGAPWPRGMSSLNTTKQERTKQSKVVTPDSGRHFTLPLVIKPNGRWAYKHGKLAK